MTNGGLVKSWRRSPNSWRTEMLVLWKMIPTNPMVVETSEYPSLVVLLWDKCQIVAVGVIKAWRRRTLLELRSSRLHKRSATKSCWWSMKKCLLLWLWRMVSCWRCCYWGRDISFSEIMYRNHISGTQCFLRTWVEVWCRWCCCHSNGPVGNVTIK